MSLSEAALKHIASPCLSLKPTINWTLDIKATPQIQVRQLLYKAFQYRVGNSFTSLVCQILSPSKDIYSHCFFIIQVWFNLAVEKTLWQI